jgi:hypothetical protein
MTEEFNGCSRLSAGLHLEITAFLFAVRRVLSSLRDFLKTIDHGPPLEVVGYYLSSLPGLRRKRLPCAGSKTRLCRGLQNRGTRARESPEHIRVNFAVPRWTLALSLASYCALTMSGRNRLASRR